MTNKYPTYESTTTTTNLALFKPTNMSSRGFATTSNSKLAVDGDVSTLVQTANSDNPWWEIDLVGVYAINNINISGFQSGNYRMLLSNSPFTTYELTSATNEASRVINFTTSTITVTETSRYVRIYRLGTNEQMTFSEINVNGSGSTSSSIYSYQWNNNTVGNTPSPECLAPGTYTVTITDTTSGCSTVESISLE